MRSQLAFFLGMQISLIATKAVRCNDVDHIQLQAVAVCRLSSQAKVEVMITNIQPVVIENIVWFSDLGFFQGESVTSCHLKSNALCS